VVRAMRATLTVAGAEDAYLSGSRRGSFAEFGRSPAIRV
jgi:hypothetical protein